ncbi:hypothetical protein ACWPKS_13865 [Coraliomargarita sp. W4R72]
MRADSDGGARKHPKGMNEHATGYERAADYERAAGGWVLVC